MKDRFVPGLISRSGITPNAVQLLDFKQYLVNEAHERDVMESGGKVVITGYPPDPNYPSSPRSQCDALTPVYRGGQNKIFQYLDKQVSHNITNSVPYTDGSWYAWDGVTRMTLWAPDTYTPAQLEQHHRDWYDYIFPNAVGGNFAMRGLKQLYENLQPFANEDEPTVREFELWNLAVINHLRDMLGLPFAQEDQGLYIRSKLSDERKGSTLWDADYPGTLDSAFGPCIPGTNMHCGESFIPTQLSHQLPYWNDYYCNYPLPITHPPLTYWQGETASIGVWWNGTAITSMSRFLKGVMFGGPYGHAGPFLGRPLFGMSIGGPDATVFRSKWSGVAVQPPPGYIV